MDGWMQGWMDDGGRLFGWIPWMTNGWMDRLIDGLNGWTDGWGSG